MMTYSPEASNPEFPAFTEEEEKDTRGIFLASVAAERLTPETLKSCEALRECEAQPETSRPAPMGTALLAVALLAVAPAAL
jgi:hypothetical protein